MDTQQRENLVYKAKLAEFDRLGKLYPECSGLSLAEVADGAAGARGCQLQQHVAHLSNVFPPVLGRRLPL